MFAVTFEYDASAPQKTPFYPAPTFPIFYGYEPGSLANLPIPMVRAYEDCGNTVRHPIPSVLTPPPSVENTTCIESPQCRDSPTFPTPPATPPVQMDPFEKMAQMLNPEFELPETDQEFLEQCRIHQMMLDEIATYD